MEDEERLKKLEAGKAKVRGGCGGAGTGTRGGDGGCGGGPGSARLDSAPRGPAANKASGAGCALYCPGSPSLFPSLPPCQPAAGDGHVAGSATGGGGARRLAPEPFKPRRLPVRLPGGLQSRQLRLSVLLMPLRKGGLRAPRAVVRGTQWLLSYEGYNSTPHEGLCYEGYNSTTTVTARWLSGSQASPQPRTSSAWLGFGLVWLHRCCLMGCTWGHPTV